MPANAHAARPLTSRSNRARITAKRRRARMPLSQPVSRASSPPARIRTRASPAAVSPNCATAGIAVDIGLMREAARELNRGFLSRIERGRPWVRVKLASSLDGRTALANGESKWITGEAARADVQRWRARSSAILTAIGTAIADDPRLTVRIDEPFIAPLRIVLDRTLRMPRDSHLLDGSAPTLVIHGAAAKPDARFENVELAALPVSQRKTRPRRTDDVARRTRHQRTAGRSRSGIVRFAAVRRSRRRIAALHRAGSARRHARVRCSRCRNSHR